MNTVLVSDIVESNGKTVRENNLELQHTIPLGTLVEVDCDYIDEHGLRLFVGGHERDCDGNPMYSLTFDKNLVGATFSSNKLSKITDPVEKYYYLRDEARFLNGFGEDCLKVIS